MRRDLVMAGVIPAGLLIGVNVLVAVWGPALAAFPFPRQFPRAPRNAQAISGLRLPSQRLLLS